MIRRWTDFLIFGMPLGELDAPELEEPDVVLILDKDTGCGVVDGTEVHTEFCECKEDTEK